MIKPVIMGGPWKGIITTASPRQLPPGFFSYSENVRFRHGKAMLIGGLSDPIPLPVDLGNLLYIENVVSRSGDTFTILIGSAKVYVGALSSFIDKTPTGWGAASPTSASTVHVVTGGAEYFCFINDVDPGLFYYDVDAGISGVIDLTAPASDVDVNGGSYIGLFKDQIIISKIRGTSSIDDLPNGYVYGAALGPLSFSGPSSGDNQIIDTEGPINSTFRIQDYFAFAKAWSITLAQYTGNPLNPHRLFTIDGIGVGSNESVQTIPSAQVVVFLGTDAQVYVFNGQQVKPIGEPVLNYLNQWAILNDAKTEITNVRSTLISSYGEYWLVFQGYGIIVWNYIDNTWQIYKFVDENGDLIDIEGFGYGFTSTAADYWDDIPGDWDDSTLYWDDYKGSVTSSVPIAVSGGYIYRLGAKVTTSAFLRTNVIRLPKPTQISRIELDVYSPTDAIIKGRYSTNGGTTWSAWTEIQIEGSSNSGKSIRAFWNFVATGDRWQFELAFEGQPYMELHDMIIDFVANSQQEIVLPGGGEHNVQISSV